MKVFQGVRQTGHLLKRPVEVVFACGASTIPEVAQVSTISPQEYDAWDCVTDGQWLNEVVVCYATGMNGVQVFLLSGVCLFGRVHEFLDGHDRTRAALRIRLALIDDE
jgi:hypothetical protein